MRVSFCFKGPVFATSKIRMSGAKARGCRFERKVQAGSLKLYGNRYLPSPWLHDGLAYHQPDGILFDLKKATITIVEVKYTHTNIAAAQLFRYKHVLSHIFPEQKWRYRLVEVVKVYDCAIAFPVRHEIIEDIEQPLQSGLGVYVWRM